MATRRSNTPKKKAHPGSSRRRLKPAAETRGLNREDIALSLTHEPLQPLLKRIADAGGVVLGSYRDPFGGRELVLAALPFRSVQPTPFQRDLSPTHTKRLAHSIEQAGSFLDPLIVIPGADGGFWTPNGRHRLAAAKVLGLKYITALIGPDAELAYRILVLNTEKAHNLKDRSLEVIRMARDLARRQPTAKESSFSSQFESAELLTLGIVYEQASRFAGGAYSSFLKKVDRFNGRTLPASIREREGYAARLLAIDAMVVKLVAAMQKQGFKSPYLRNYIVARINPVRFVRSKPGETAPALPIGQALTRMTAAARAFKIDPKMGSDLSWFALGSATAE
jgi:ParB family transcriptional regulator, chromosome partitioning protein